MDADPGPAGPGRRARLGAPLSVDFVNTRYAVRGKLRDAIGTPDELVTWLRTHASALALADLGEDLADKVGTPEVWSFQALRDTIGGLFRAAADRRLGTPTELATLNHTALSAPCAPTLVVRGPAYGVVERSRDTGLPVALGALARDAIYVLGGTADGELHACDGPGCVLLFVSDDPRRRWCSGACGNRARAARHYHRHRAVAR